MGQKVKGQMAKKGLGKSLLPVGSDGCMGSRQSAKPTLRYLGGLTDGSEGQEVDDRGAVG